MANVKLNVNSFSGRYPCHTLTLDSIACVSSLHLTNNNFSQLPIFEFWKLTKDPEKCPGYLDLDQPNKNEKWNPRKFLLLFPEIQEMRIQNFSNSNFSENSEITQK